MIVGIVTNLNGRGLEKDARLLVPLLKAAGHEVELLQFDEPCEKKFGLLIFLEITPRNLIGLSEVPPWIIVNPEFLKPENVKLIDRHFSKVLCKTHEAHRICSELFGEKAHYVGFISEDRYDASIERKKKFLHVAGQSRFKGTTSLIDAFKWKRNGKLLTAELTIVADWLEGEEMPAGVRVLRKISDEELKHLQNECLFHLQPSQTEGWSHVIHESLSVNATILTVDFPPMNEVESAYMIHPVSTASLQSARICEVSALDVYNAMNELSVIGQIFKPREEFLKGNADFKVAFAAQLEDITPKKIAPALHVKGDGLQIAFIGNFKAEHSTENQIKWALEEGLGHDVEMLQENEVNLSAIRSAMEFSDLLLWVRTPGWLHVTDCDMLDLLAGAKIPTVSIHLDKFWGIPEREALIGVHPFWKTKFVWTADGSRQGDFAARGVNHFWMRPAVSEVYCHPGQPWDIYRCDVGFVGAREYHKEYPFREQMVSFLEKTYGDRFKHFTGIRGHALNDVYASCKVVAGDCIFAGTDSYWSDRVPETVGRYGFLVHPTVLNLRSDVAMFYNPQDLEDLHRTLETALGFTSSYRKEFSRHAAKVIKKHDSWTVRMREILEVVL